MQRDASLYPMRLWIDDLRTPPDQSWVWLKTSRDALTYLRALYGSLVGAPGYSATDEELETVSFDHDLGGDDTTRPVILWMAEFDFWPNMVQIHTQNPVGREFLVGITERYAPWGVEIRQYLASK